MKKVLLSHDDKVLMYSVPDEVADHLDEYCLDFASNWIWKNPEGAKLLKNIDGLMVEWLFPEQRSMLIEQLDFYDYELPEEYDVYPQFNF